MYEGEGEDAIGHVPLHVYAYMPLSRCRPFPFPLYSSDAGLQFPVPVVALARPRELRRSAPTPPFRSGTRPLRGRARKVMEATGSYAVCPVFSGEDGEC